MVYNLRRHVERTSKHFIQLVLIIKVGGESEIRELDLQVFQRLDEDVFWLYIPVHDVVRMHVVESEEQLIADIHDLALRESTVDLDLSPLDYKVV